VKRDKPKKSESKFVLPIPIFLAYLVPLDVDVTGNITAKLCEVWSEFNIFCTLGTKIMGWGDVRYCFAMAILVLILFLLSFRGP
jgi:hypothetical protein